MLTSKQVTIKVNSGDAEVTITVDADNRIAINNPATEQSTQEMLKRFKAHAAKSEQEDVEEYNNKFVPDSNVAACVRASGYLFVRTAKTDDKHAAVWLRADSFAVYYTWLEIVETANNLGVKLEKGWD